MLNEIWHMIAAHDNYVKKPFHEPRFKDEFDHVFALPVAKDCTTTAQRFDKTEGAQKVANQLKTAHVVVDENTRKQTPPETLPDLSIISAKLSKDGASAKAVLFTYQKMYEATIVSYPRTEDKTITPEQLNELKPFIPKLATLVGVSMNQLNVDKELSTRYVKAGGAHGANRPGTNVPDSLDSLKQYGPLAIPIYDYLTRKFLAIFAENAEFLEHHAHLQEYPDLRE